MAGIRHVLGWRFRLGGGHLGGFAYLNFEVDLIDAQTFHLKSLIQLMRAIGDYSLPNLN
jgi:hypothetical protein